MPRRLLPQAPQQRMQRAHRRHRRARPVGEPAPLRTAVPSCTTPIIAASLRGYMRPRTSAWRPCGCLSCPCHLPITCPAQRRRRSANRLRCWAITLRARAWTGRAARLAAPAPVLQRVTARPSRVIPLAAAGFWNRKWAAVTSSAFHQDAALLQQPCGAHCGIQCSPATVVALLSRCWWMRALLARACCLARSASRLRHQRLLHQQPRLPQLLSSTRSPTHPCPGWCLPRSQLAPWKLPRPRPVRSGLRASQPSGAC